MQHHVVIGSGPVGSGIATRLAEQGTRVTVITRSGSGPDHALVTKVRADASDLNAVVAAATGAAVIYNCANPAYHRWPTDWPPIHHALLTAAERTGAVLVMMDNLYAFGPGTPMPMREDTPMRATGSKGATRATMANELLAAHAAGKVRATLARASDFYGPQVIGAVLGERAMPKILAGKKVQLLGSLDSPHSLTYMPDVVTTLVTLGADERAWGRPWHVPNAEPLTQREWVAALARAAGTTVGVSAVPKIALSALGIFNPMLRELKETAYQFESAWIADASATETMFGLTATPIADAAAATVAWWRSRPSA